MKQSFISERAHDLAIAVLTNETMLQRWIKSHSNLSEGLDIFEIYKVLYKFYEQQFIETYK